MKTATGGKAAAKTPKAKTPKAKAKASTKPKKSLPSDPTTIIFNKNDAKGNQFYTTYNAP